MCFFKKMLVISSFYLHKEFSINIKMHANMVNVVYICYI